MTVYNKLVRDKIPDLIRTQGETPDFRTLDDGEYFRRLEEKLDEEVAEYHKDHSGEELADILTVVLALAECRGISREELTRIYREKAEKRGTFRGRIFLMGKEVDTEAESPYNDGSEK